MAALWPLAVAAVAICLAIVFGLHARRTARKLGEIEKALAVAVAEGDELRSVIDALSEPEPTDDRLSEAAAEAARAAGSGVPEVERGRADRLADLARDVGSAARDG